MVSELNRQKTKKAAAQLVCSQLTAICGARYAVMLCPVEEETVKRHSAIMAETDKLQVVARTGLSEVPSADPAGSPECLQVAREPNPNPNPNPKQPQSVHQLTLTLGP